MLKVSSDVIFIEDDEPLTSNSNSINENELSVYNFTSLYRRVDSFTNEKHDEFTYAYGLAYSVSSDTQKFVYNLKGYLETYAESSGIIAHFTIKYQYKK